MSFKNFYSSSVLFEKLESHAKEKVRDLIFAAKTKLGDDLPENLDKIVAELRKSKEAMEIMDNWSDDQIKALIRYHYAPSSVYEEDQKSKVKKDYVEARKHASIEDSLEMVAKQNRISVETVKKLLNEDTNKDTKRDADPDCSMCNGTGIIPGSIPALDKVCDCRKKKLKEDSDPAEDVDGPEPKVVASVKIRRGKVEVEIDEDRDMVILKLNSKPLLSMSSVQWKVLSRAV